MKKKIIIATILILITLIFGVTVNAEQIHYKSEEPIIKSADISVSKGDFSGMYSTSGTTFNNVGGNIIGIAQYLCYGAALIVLLVKGVQFMTKAPEGKAEAKKELVSYAIGALILFTIVTIIRIISDLAMNKLF